MMKKISNRLMLAAIIFMLICLFRYDYLLRAEYLTGNYKTPYAGYMQLPYKDFDIADLHSSTATNVKFVQGPFSVRIDRFALTYTKIKQLGSRLQIDAAFDGDYLFNPNQYVMVISCPKMPQVNTDATYESNKKQVTDTTVRDDWKMRQVLIDGFKQDSLKITQDYGSTVVLANNIIGTIDASIGGSPGSGSKIIVENTNHFETAAFTVGNQSKLQLENAMITKLDFKLADSAKLIINGAAQHFLNHSKPVQP